MHARVSYKTSFDSKQPKLEPKLVSILFETRRLFRLFRFNIETACFGVSIEPKQNKNNRNKQKKKKLVKSKTFKAIVSRFFLKFLYLRFFSLFKATSMSCTVGEFLFSPLFTNPAT
jgi:hypothetical protein